MRALVIAVLLSAWAAAQPSFQVTSVRINKSGPQSPNGFFPSPGRLRVTNMSLEQLVQAAWHLPTGTLFGISDWMQSDRFDIEATTATASGFENELAMLQALLQDRFELRFHRESRQMKTLALTMSKRGPLFGPSSDQSQRERVRILPGEISGTGIPFGHFVTILQAQLGYPIANETGLSGNFDLALRFARDGASDEAPAAAALEEQLGLKLETRRGPVEVFVVDSAQRPSQN